MLFSRKKKIQVHPTISLNNVQVERVSYQKHLGILLDELLNFIQHINSAIKKLRHNLPRKSLVTIYKAFLRPLIDYDDIIHDQPQNESFCEKKTESVQYNAILAITGSIQGTSSDKIYQELG